MAKAQRPDASEVTRGAVSLPRSLATPAELWFSGHVVCCMVHCADGGTSGPRGSAQMPLRSCALRAALHTHKLAHLVYSQWRCAGARPVRRHTRREVRPMPLHPCPPCQRVRCKPRDTMPSPPARDAPPSRSATQKPRAAHLRRCAHAGLGDRVMLYAATARCVGYRS